MKKHFGAVSRRLRNVFCRERKRNLAVRGNYERKEANSMNIFTANNFAKRENAVLLATLTPAA